MLLGTNSMANPAPASNRGCAGKLSGPVQGGCVTDDAITGISTAAMVSDVSAAPVGFKLASTANTFTETDDVPVDNLPTRTEKPVMSYLMTVAPGATVAQSGAGKHCAQKLELVP